MKEKLIRRFPSGAVRSDDTGRSRPDWVSPQALDELGKHLAENSNDFGATNYLKGIPVEECLASLMRHYCEYQKTKEFKDLRSMTFNGIAALHTACLIKDGDYKEIYPKTELVNQGDYLKELEIPIEKMKIKQKKAPRIRLSDEEFYMIQSMRDKA